MRGDYLSGSRITAALVQPTRMHYAEREREKNTVPLRHHTSRVIPSATPGHRDGFTFIFGFAPRGVCRAASCYHERGELLPHRFTLTAVVLQKRIAAIVQIKLVGGLFSVALSIGSQRRKNVPVHRCLPSGR
jgi:hypothetical protein